MLFNYSINIFSIFSFFESPNLMNNTRQKGLFDCNNTFCKELACGLRSVRKELMNIHPQSTHSQQLIEYVYLIFIKHILN